MSRHQGCLQFVVVYTVTKLAGGGEDTHIP